MSPDPPPSFEYELLSPQNKMGTSLLLLLCWLAAADGNIDQNEREGLERIASGTKTTRIDPLLEIARNSNLTSVMLAIRYMGHEVGVRLVGREDGILDGLGEVS